MTNTAFNPKTPISVLVIIYNEKQQCLLLERADKPGFWQSVTGSLENDDANLANTAQREVLEETGINANQYQLDNWHHQIEYEIYEHWRHRYAKGVTYNTEHWFSLLVPENIHVQLSPNEHLRYQWLNWQDAANMASSPSNQDAITQLFTKRIPCSSII